MYVKKNKPVQKRSQSTRPQKSKSAIIYNTNNEESLNIQADENIIRKENQLKNLSNKDQKPVQKSQNSIKNSSKDPKGSISKQPELRRNTKNRVTETSNQNALGKNSNIAVTAITQSKATTDKEIYQTNTQNITKSAKKKESAQGGFQKSLTQSQRTVYKSQSKNTSSSSQSRISKNDSKSHQIESSNCKPSAQTSEKNQNKVPTTKRNDLIKNETQRTKKRISIKKLVTSNSANESNEMPNQQPSVKEDKKNDTDKLNESNKTTKSSSSNRKFNNDGQLHSSRLSDDKDDKFNQSCKPTTISKIKSNNSSTLQSARRNKDEDNDQSQINKSSKTTAPSNIKSISKSQSNNRSEANELNRSTKPSSLQQARNSRTKKQPLKIQQIKKEESDDTIGEPAKDLQSSRTTEKVTRRKRSASPSRNIYTQTSVELVDPEPIETEKKRKLETKFDNKFIDRIMKDIDFLKKVSVSYLDEIQEALELSIKSKNDEIDESNNKIAFYIVKGKDYQMQVESLKEFYGLDDDQ